MIVPLKSSNLCSASQDPVFLFISIITVFARSFCYLTPLLCNKFQQYRIICLSYSPLISQCLILKRSLTVVCCINERKEGEIRINC